MFIKEQTITARDVEKKVWLVLRENSRKSRSARQYQTLAVEILSIYNSAQRKALWHIENLIWTLLIHRGLR